MFRSRRSPKSWTWCYTNTEPIHHSADSSNSENDICAIYLFLFVPVLQVLSYNRSNHDSQTCCTWLPKLQRRRGSRRSSPGSGSKVQRGRSKFLKSAYIQLFGLAKTHFFDIVLPSFYMLISYTLIKFLAVFIHQYFKWYLLLKERQIINN